MEKIKLNNVISESPITDELFAEVSNLIERSHKQFVSFANSTLTMLFWEIGNRVNQSILNNRRAVYGKQIVVTLSRKLVAQFGRNFEEKNLRRMMQFSNQFSDLQIVVTLSRQLNETNSKKIKLSKIIFVF